MAATSCVLPSVSKGFATKVVDSLSEEQLKKFDITEDRKEDAITAIQAIVERYVGAETDFSKREEMLQNVDGFVSDMENYFGVTKVSEDEYENAKEQYDHFTKTFLEPMNTGKLSSFTFDESQQDLAEQMEAILASHDQVVTYYKEFQKDGKTVKSISFILKEPQKQKGKTAQQKTMDTIDSIISIESEWVDFEITDGTNFRYLKRNKDIPEGWEKTGRSHYKYNGKVVLTNSVSNDVNGYDPDADYPILSAPIGTYVDSVGRLFFDKNSLLYDDEGNLKGDDELKDIIATELGGIFTVQGLKNLIGDYQKLEDQFKEKWGNDIRIFSGELDLFGKQPNSNLWIHGKPDLLVIDKQGVVHVVDFKTSKMTDIKGYQTFSYENADKYGKQVSRYIRMLESYGLKVDNEPYIVQIDTWYDSSDHGEKNRNAEGEQIEGRRDIYIVEKDYLGITEEGNEMTLGEYAEKNGSTREEILSDTDKTILYMEPRLHVGYEDGFGFSEELAALRGKEDIPFDSEVSYEQQWTTLSEEDKAAFRWLNGKPVIVRTAQGIVTLSSSDIESNPTLIGSQEIQAVANLVMYRVSRIISDLQRGDVVEGIPLSTPSDSGQPSNVFKGKSRADIIRIVGIDSLIDEAFKVIEEKYHDDFPTEQEYQNEDYDDLEYEFVDEADYQEQKKMNDKAKWLIDHKEQLIVAGSAKLISLENSIIPIKDKTQDFNEKVPAARFFVSDEEANIDSGDNEAIQTFAEQYLEGITDVEAWMMGQRNYSPKASLAQEIKRMYEDLDMVDSKGNKVLDSYGWGFTMPIDATQAIQTTLDACKNCETNEEQIAALKNLAKNPANTWINQILDKINSDKNIKKKFFRHFRKDALNYSISQVKFDKKTGQRVVETRIINTKSAYDTITQSLGASFRNGTVGAVDVNGVIMPLISKNAFGENILTRLGTGKDSSTVAGQLRKEVAKWEKNIVTIYKSYNPLRDGKSQEERLDYIAKQLQEQTFDGKTIIEGVTEIMNGIGIMVPQSVVLDTILKKIKGEKTNNAARLLNGAKKILQLLNTMEREGGIPSGLAGNSAFREYQPMLMMLSDSVQEFVEASSYQDGKTYYTYTNPSRLGHIVRNLKDALEDEDKFERYISDNFGRYTGWFKTVDGSEWLCDWVERFATDASVRKALAHKVELSYLGNQYKDLGSLGFQLSILHNYFGSKDDQSSNSSYRWFAMPTMSNKPTNEFIRMLKYKDIDKGGKDEIIDKVLMKTFRQEMNRIADVLYHYIHHTVSTDQIDLTDDKLRKAGWSEEDINGLKDRIENRSITANDLIRLSHITSGAKFHFLWYLNNELVGNPELSGRVTDRINQLLTPSEEQNINPEYEAETNRLVRNAIASNMERVVDGELEEMRRIGLFDKVTKKINGKEVQVLKYQEEFGGKLGSNQHGEGEQEMENALRDFIWQDIAANINIIQITGGDLAYYGNAINYQKRIAQEHSPGLHIMSDEDYDDGFLRSVHISDEMVRGEIAHNAETALEEYLEQNGSSMTQAERDDYKKMISVIVSDLTDTKATDGQSYSSPTSERKKLAAMGEWDDEKEKAYKAIIHGDFNINHLGIMLQPKKPFVTSDMAKYSGSTTMELRKTPLQDKNSEYLIILAEALARGAGKRSKLVAVCDFMEKTAEFGNGKQGIDTVHFASVNKVGKSGVIDIAAFDEQFQKDSEAGNVSEEDYNELLTEYLLKHVRTKGMKGESVQEQEDFDNQETLVREGKLKREETLYNAQYVDTIPFDDYIIQQEVPAHLLEHQQLYGSQIRILGVSDITPGTQFDVNGETMSDKDLVDEYKDLHAQNITESFEALMEELGLDKLQKFIDEQNKEAIDGGMIVESLSDLPAGSEERNEVYKNLYTLLQKELSKDAKYGLDMRRACSLRYDANGNVVDFVVPLMDPIQSKRIQMLLNSIIKKSINKQRINGGPVVQTTAYDKNLHIKFKDSKGNILPTFEEYGKSVEEYKKFLKENQAGIAHFECYMPIPNAGLERLMTNPDGSMMSFEELQKRLPKDTFESIMKVIGYRIPTEDKYSMLPLKIIGFVPKAAGQVIMMPQEITYLTGSDFDIDKMYIMMKSFGSLDSIKDKKEAKATADKYMRETGEQPFKNMNGIIQQIQLNADKIMEGDKSYSWMTGISKNDPKDKVQKFIEWYKNELFKTQFTEYLYDKEDISEMSKRDAKKARDNRILDLQWAVLTNKDTASKILNPGNFNEQKKVGRIIRILKSGAINPETEERWTWNELSNMKIKELDNLMENANPHNTTLPSSKIYFQRQNMQGSQMVGIFANNNVSHAFMTFQKVGIDLQGQYDNSFMFDGVTIGDHDNPTVLDPQRGFNGQLISKTIASFLAASVDTAKDPTLADMNVNTFTGGVAMVLARLGFDTAAIGLFLSQPVIIELSDLFFKNKTDGYYDGETAILEMASKLKMKRKELLDTTGIKDETLSKENLIQHLSDEDYDRDGDNYQKRVLIGFYNLFKIARDLQELTFCTKFNSVNNAVGPTIADTMEDLDRVNRFVSEIEKSVFYVPDSDYDPQGFTDPADVITNDPILNAFFESTVKSGGASERIFKNFFPHYFRGFQNVKDYFQENYMNGKKISSKLFNQLLDEYLYYLLTYNGKGDNEYRPTIPYDTEHKERLVKRLVSQFQDVVNIRGRKPNMILDQTLGGNCLRVRQADEFLAADILVFNGGQLNADGQQKVRNAWSDLITMNDPNLSEEDNEKIKRFGVDLFFYTLMRNGFGFSPKTLMHLASVIVRYNARYGSEFNNYINGLSGLKELDNFLMGNEIEGSNQIDRFCKQFLRNHADNRQLVPNIDYESDTIVGVSANLVEFGVPINEEHKLYQILQGEDNPYKFITITRKEKGKLYRELYELEEVGGSPIFTESGMTKVSYKKSNRLGLTNNFIEYNANEDLDTSYFEDIRNESEDALEDEDSQQEQGKDEQDKIMGGSDIDSRSDLWQSKLVPIMKELEGPQEGKQGRTYRSKLRDAFLKADSGSELAQEFNALLNQGSKEEKQKTMDEINKKFEEQDKC